MSSTSAGWRPDPSGRHEHRYRDGTGWTDDVADGGIGSTDPMTASPDDPTIAKPGIGDPTATQPTIGDPTTPGIPVPPTAWPPASTPPPAPAGADGSKRNLWIGLGVLGAVAIAVIAFLVLGGDDDDNGQEAADRTDVAEDAGEGDEADAPASDDGDESTDDAEALDDPFGDLGEFDPEDLEAIYKDMFDLSDAQAECLAAELAPLIETADPNFTPDVGEMMDMFERCDIDPSDLGGLSDG